MAFHRSRRDTDSRILSLRHHEADHGPRIESPGLAGFLYNNQNVVIRIPEVGDTEVSCRGGQCRGGQAAEELVDPGDQGLESPAGDLSRLRTIGMEHPDIGASQQTVQFAFGERVASHAPASSTGVYPFPVTDGRGPHMVLAIGSHVRTGAHPFSLPHAQTQQAHIDASSQV